VGYDLSMHQKMLGALVLASAVALATAPATAQTAGTGTITGHIKLKGPAPANPTIRMGADPKCGQMNPGKRPVQNIVSVAPDGGLANAFVHVTGAVPGGGGTQQAVLDQKNCLYSPRVIGVRAGQAVSIRNDDNLMHNVHGLSTKGQEFNTSQPKAGMVYMATLKKEEVMVHVKCDIHSWMNAYIGVVPNSFYAVSDGSGVFTIPNVPAGKRTVSVWHERYGELMGTVDVKAGQKATLELSYPGTAKAAASHVRELVVPAEATAILIQTSGGASE
jgi:plastocyanin